MNEKILRSYIDKCITDSCTAEKRDNDVKFGYMIIGNEFLFAIKSNYAKVIRRVTYRLLHNIQKNFNLHFNLVYPDAYKVNGECARSNEFCLDDFGNVSPNHTICQWTLFDQERTVSHRKGNRPEDELGIPHMDMLKVHGFDIDYETSFDKFVEAYKSAYGLTPLEWYMSIFQDKKQIDPVIETRRGIYNEDEINRGCGYWSVCYEAGSACMCSPSSKVRQGFNNDVWMSMKDELEEMNNK